VTWRHIGERRTAALESASLVPSLSDAAIRNTEPKANPSPSGMSPSEVSAAAPPNRKKLSEVMIEQIQDLRDQDKTTTEIAGILGLGLDFDTGANVPARGSLGDRSIRSDNDEEADGSEDDEEQEDDEETYDPFLANRGRVAGSEI
jgi:hypothetical protein